MPQMTPAAFWPIGWRLTMHRSRNTDGRKTTSSPAGGRLRFEADPPAPFRFPRETVVNTDEIIAGVERAFEHTQQRLDDLRAMLDPFPDNDDPPRAA